MLEEIKELLYEQNEYGYSYQNSEVELPEELVQELAAEYGNTYRCSQDLCQLPTKAVGQVWREQIKCNFIARLPKEV